MSSQSQHTARISPTLVIFLALPLMGIGFALLTLATNPAPASTITTGAQTANPNAAVQQINETPRAPTVLHNPAPDFVLSTLDGQTVRLSDYKGRPVFINFWATWCVPCIEELPALQAFAAEQVTQGDQGAVVLAINTETARDVQDFIEVNTLDLPDVPLLLDLDASVKEAYGVYMLPTTYIVAPDGVIANVKFGELTIEAMYTYLNALTPASSSRGS